MPNSIRSYTTPLSRYRGCLLAGACGDALGAPVEFLRRSQIIERFGEPGITEYLKAYGRRLDHRRYPDDPVYRRGAIGRRGPAGDEGYRCASLGGRSVLEALVNHPGGRADNIGTFSVPAAIQP